MAHAPVVVYAPNLFGDAIEDAEVRARDRASNEPQPIFNEAGDNLGTVVTTNAHGFAELWLDPGQEVRLAVTGTGIDESWPYDVPAVNTAGGALTGTYPDPELADGAVTTAKMAAGAVGDAQVSNTAAIAYSKLAPLATGSVVAGSAGVATAVPLSGDATVNAAGTVTIASGAVTTVKIAAGTILNSNVAAGAGIVGSKLDLTSGTGAIHALNPAGWPSTNGMRLGRADSGSDKFGVPDFLFTADTYELMIKGLIVGDIGDVPNIVIRRAGPDNAAYNAALGTMHDTNGLGYLGWQAHDGIAWTALGGNGFIAQISADLKGDPTPTNRGGALVLKTMNQNQTGGYSGDPADATRWRVRVEHDGQVKIGPVTTAAGAVATSKSNLWLSGGDGTGLTINTSTLYAPSAGKLASDGAGKDALALPDVSTTTGLTVGGDTNLYRNAANVWKTDDALIVGPAAAGSALTVGGVSDANKLITMSERGVYAARNDNNDQGSLINLTNGGIAAADQGLGIMFNLGSSGSPELAGSIRMLSEGGTWAGNRKSYIQWRLSAGGGSVVEGLRLKSDKTLNVLGPLDHDGSTVGFFGVAQTARPAAYTQNYTTATRTVNAYTTNPQNVAYAGLDNAQPATPYAAVADLNALRVAYENLRASHDNLLSAYTQTLDDLQLEGLLA